MLAVRPCARARGAPPDGLSRSHRPFDAATRLVGKSKRESGASRLGPSGFELYHSSAAPGWPGGIVDLVRGSLPATGGRRLCARAIRESAKSTGAKAPRIRMVARVAR